MQNLKPFLKSITKTDPATTVVASAMFTVCALAMILTWGILALAAVFSAAPRAVVRMAVVPPGGGLPRWLWSYSISNRADMGFPILANVYGSGGLETVVGQLNIREQPPSETILFLSSQGERVNTSYQQVSPVLPLIAVFDSNNDGVNELLVDSYQEFFFSSFSLRLTDVQGNELKTPAIPPSPTPFFSLGYPAIVDLNRDGVKDYVLTVIYRSTSEPNKDFTANVVYALDGTGGVLWRYEVGASHSHQRTYCTSDPITPDIDGDGKNDVLFLSCDCVSGDQVQVRGDHIDPADPALVQFPFSENVDLERAVIRVGIDNVTRINDREVCGTALFRLDDSGGLVWRRFIQDTENQLWGSWERSQVSAADLDGDGKLEVITTPYTERPDPMFVVRPTSEILWRTPPPAGDFAVVGLGNLTRDPGTEILAVFVDFDRNELRWGVFNSRGDIIWQEQFPAAIPPAGHPAERYQAVIFDSDDTPPLEILLANGGNVRNPQQPTMLSLHDGYGRRLWEYEDVDYVFGKRGAIADIDGDGTLDGVFISCQKGDPDCSRQRFTALSFPSSRVPAYGVAWGMYQHDLHRTAWYDYRDPSAFPAPYQVVFRRGDANGDGVMDISDPIATLSAVYQNGPALNCQDAADTDDDGDLDKDDAVFSLNYLFLGTAPPLPPGPVTPGSDPTADGLGCAQYPAP